MFIGEQQLHTGRETHSHLHKNIWLLAPPLQVFISEQELYSGRELERHMKGGDVEGPMAAAGFKGHPDCR